MFDKSGKKYELTDEICVFNTGEKDHIVYRIKALKDFGDVKKGELGGYIASENNLSQDGTCWVYDNAQVWGDVIVSGNALPYNNVQVSGKVTMCDNSNK
jgi:hypothetical protein